MSEIVCIIEFRWVVLDPPIFDNEKHVTLREVVKKKTDILRSG